MTDHDDVAQRAYHSPDPDRVVIRDLDEDEEGMFAVRMPISSTLEARDGDAFDADRLRGWADQINEGTVGVFLDHGTNPDLGGRYSGTGKLGYYADAEVVERDDGESELVADTRMMDPDTLPDSTGALREHLSRIKSQAERDVPITQSVGWADNTGDRNVPGGSDLLEGSIVGVPSDTEASSHGAATAMARAAVTGRPDADPEKLVADFRAVVMGSDRASDDMTDDTDSADDGSADGDRDESDGISAEEFREQMLEMQRTQTESLERQGETLSALSNTLREDDDDDEDEEEADEDDDEDDDDDGDDRSADIDLDDVPEDIRSTLDDDASAADVVEAMRDAYADAEPEIPDNGDDGERDEEPDDERTADPKNLL